MDNIKISKVELVIGKKKISLTIEEAIELKQLLSRTFDKPQVTHIPYSYPYYPVTPWWTDTDWYGPATWYGTTTISNDGANDIATIAITDGNWTASSSGDTLMFNCPQSAANIHLFALED